MPIPSEVADLILELTDPRIHQGDGGARRAAARASLVYEPPSGSDERRLAGPRFSVVAPIGPVEKHEIDWYLESYHRWTSPVFQDRARDVERRLPEWGRLIYDVLAKSEEAREPLESWRRAPKDASRRFTVLIDESGDVEAAEAATLLLAIPWELAHDGRAYLFQGGRGIRVRRRLHGRTFARTAVTEAPIRVLLVNPRPEDDNTDYIDHRVSARPLLDAFDKLGSLAELTLLQPPTLKALSKELEEARRAKRPYHVVHFDGHGVYDRREGRGGLCFEDSADEKKLVGRRHKLVMADEVAATLRDHGISLVFLEACQSAKAEDDPTSSVAGRLLQDGVSSVVAMSHTVLVETTRRFVGAFYGELVRGSRVGDRTGEADTLNQLGILYSLMERREDAIRFFRQAVEIYVETKDLAKEGVLRTNVANHLVNLRRFDEARQEILRAIECKEAFGYAAEPWKTFEILLELERVIGDGLAAVRAREKAFQAFLSYRQAGGENHSDAGRLVVAAGQAMITGKEEEIATQIAEMRGFGVEPEYDRFLEVLQKIVGGSRDPAFASDPEMHYKGAVELTLLLESLASAEASPR